jgi:hypothetical protein
MNEIIYEAIKKDLVEVFFVDKDRQRLITEKDGTFFDSQRASGYYRRIDSIRRDRLWLTTYKIGLFFDNVCEKDLFNLIANLDYTPRLGLVKKMEVKKVFFDSNFNIQKELKIDNLNRKLILIDVEVLEEFCKTEIKC